MKPFDPLNTPLSGNNLIESSAGTGKTFAIEGLFLRLIIEKQIPAENILVVTFTQSATEELKHRILRKLILAREALTNGFCEDPFVGIFVQRLEHKANAARRVQDAIVDFDRAPILTIHGFCQRILYENAFETGSLFDTELISNQTELLNQIGDDFWRRHFYLSHPELVSYAFARNVKGPEYFLNLLVSHPASDADIIPNIDRPSFDELPAYREAYQKLKSDWSACRKEVADLLHHPALKRSVYGEYRVSALKSEMDRFLDPKAIGFPLFKGFDKFTTGGITAATKKNQTPPAHSFFTTCEELYDKASALQLEMEGCLLYLKGRFFRYVSSELFKRKQDHNIQFFDDLLLKVRNALKSPRGHALTAAVQKRFQAALVDEFQDTDSAQYDIFSILFGSAGHILFMIGDPKQAIYAFRGADIFSYMNASRNVSQKHTLLQNWRSSPGLVKAINTLFSSVDMPFVFEDIPFRSGVSARTDEGCEFAGSTAPLQIWFFEGYEDRPLNKSDAVELIAEQVATEIAGILTDEKSRFKEGDIAILVRTNRQAQIVKTTLSRRRISSVLYNAGNVFETKEALDLYRVLSSISEPADERKFIAAQTTDILGMTGEKLKDKDRQPEWRERQNSRLRQYFDLWRTQGFMRMFRTLMNRGGIRERLLAFPDGERRLTNLLHLAELMHQASVEKEQGVAGLVKWLEEQLDSALPGPDTHQLRLETDARAVKIVTIHKSKGLEYPVVFCPFSWEGSEIRDETVVFHHPETDRLTIELNPDKNSRHYLQARKELLAENIRLLYVALTRAKTRCYLVWGNFKSAETSAMAYLLHYRHAADEADLFNLMQKAFGEKTNHDLLSDLNELARRSEQTIQIVRRPVQRNIVYTPSGEPVGPLAYRRFSGIIDNSWQITSYSSLVSHARHDDSKESQMPYGFAGSNEFEPEAMPGRMDPGESPDHHDIFGFPKGARTGIFFHDIFEHIDFSAKDALAAKSLIETKLKVYGFTPDWMEAVWRMVQNVLHTCLSEKDSSLVLCAIEKRRRVDEMGFYFPIRSISAKALNDILRDTGGSEISAGFPEQVEKLIFSPARGFMKGYIDLVFQHRNRFYIVDWKSNYLGPQIECYNRSGLAQNMQETLYMIQYLLYTLALHQYLSMRLPGYRYEKDFGGVFYIYCRGVDPRRGCEYGIYADRPNAKLIGALAEALIPAT